MFSQVSYNVIIERFKAYADGHYLIKRFSHGQIDVADIMKDAEYAWMHVVPVSMNPATGTRSFSFDVIFADMPRDKEDKTEYQRESLSDCIRLAEDLLAEIQNGYTIFGRDVELEQGATITPFMEEYTHVLTGVTLSLTMTFSWDWNACEIPADWSAGGSGSGGTGGGGASLVLKTNGTPNVVQTILDLVDGTGIDIIDLGDGRVQFTNTGGGGGAVSWGAIVGTLSNQTDLQNALNLKADISSLGAVAFSNDYNDLDNLPTIPPAQVNSDWNAVSGVEEILNKPTIPDELRDLTDCFYSSPQQNDVLLFDSLNNIFTNGQLGAVAYSNDYNDLSNTPTLPPVIGDMLTSTYDTDVDGVVDSAERVQIVVRNSTGVTLTKGQVVYLSGATGNRPNAILADASTEATSSKTIGLVIEDIPNNSDGQIAVNGTLHDLDTSAFNAGDTLWLSETAGAYQANTPPSEPAHSVFIGYVARSHPNLGRIVLAIQNGYELNELHGVLVPSPSNNDVLYYDGTTSLWKNKALTKSDVGLGNVDNTSDANKPISTATQTALNAKVDSNSAITGATKTKITYDSKGLVTAGADIVASDISNSTDVGRGLVTLPNPSAISFIRINANNTIDTRTPAQVLTDLGISSTIILNRNFSDTTPITGTTNTLVFAVLIPANTLQANDWINFKVFVRVNTAGTNLNVYINTTPTIPSVSPITIGNLTLASNNGGLYERNFMIPSIGSSGSIKYFQGTALSSYSPANFLAQSATINTTIDQYLVLSAQNSAGASFLTNGNIITITR